MRSFFDDILALSEDRPAPADCLHLCRHMVLLAWTAWLRITEAQMIQEQVKMYRGTAEEATATAAAINVRDTTTLVPSWHDTSWTLPWKQRQFSRLMRAKTKLEALDAELYRNMDALGMMATPEAATTTATTTTTTTAAGDPPPLLLLAGWEADAWRALGREMTMLKARLDIMSQAYTQAVAVRESLTANEMARQVGLLTSLAALFIPVSFVAAIFSMGGAFAAGESLFWVYWVVAVPVVASCCVLLFTRWGRLVWQRGAAGGRGKSLV
jgi:Mg2+ and Co2+ transporter CorA